MTHGTTKTRNAGRAAGRTRRRPLVITALAVAALSMLTPATLPSPALSQAAQGGTRGIDCDKPRYNAQGKLIL
ncbi:MAG: hypothetical protein F4Z60_00005, partial [Chloroflexi bacterium]|nr:hypothetical protein [Chloroflexota bacterium]